jgi:tetratricopeptide (TPR) repeat protein
MLVMTCLWIGVMNCPAPLIYRPGEGWTYEAVGAGAAWQRKRAKDQLIVAQEAFDAGQYRLALKAAKHTTKTWPLSDSSGRAQYLIGRCYEARKMDERAFKEYQKALKEYGRRFKAGMGAEAIRELLRTEDLETLSLDLRLRWSALRGGWSQKQLHWTDLTLQPGERRLLVGRQRLKVVTTRRVEPGPHRLALVINGEERADAPFTLTAPEGS